MIVWLNGTFGVGKTTTSRELTQLSEGLRPFDPEWVGYMLANNLTDQPVDDFQRYPSWRRLVPLVADEISRITGQGLVAAQTILAEEYWREVAAGLESYGHEVFHVLLDADSATLHARIDADDREPPRIRPWRHRHVAIYESARTWLIDSADLVVDTSTVDTHASARLILSAIT